LSDYRSHIKFGKFCFVKSTQPFMALQRQLMAMKVRTIPEIVLEEKIAWEKKAARQLEEWHNTKVEKFITESIQSQLDYLSECRATIGNRNADVDIMLPEQGGCAYQEILTLLKDHPAFVERWYKCVHGIGFTYTWTEKMRYPRHFTITWSSKEVEAEVTKEVCSGRVAYEQNLRAAHNLLHLNKALPSSVVCKIKEFQPEYIEHLNQVHASEHWM